VAGTLTLIRAGYGVALLCGPGALIRLTAGPGAAGQRADPGSPVPLGGGAAVDLLHAASMLALGATDRRVRRTTFTDAALETALAAAGAWAAALT